MCDNMKIFNLKCEDDENIYDIRIEALNIDKAVELSKEYLNKYNLYPIGIWEV